MLSGKHDGSGQVPGLPRAPASGRTWAAVDMLMCLLSQVCHHPKEQPRLPSSRNLGDSVEPLCVKQGRLGVPGGTARMHSEHIVPGMEDCQEEGCVSSKSTWQHLATLPDG